jgi:hypothetical protein
MIQCESGVNLVDSSDEASFQMFIRFGHIYAMCLLAHLSHDYHSDNTYSLPEVYRKHKSAHVPFPPSR